MSPRWPPPLMTGPLGTNLGVLLIGIFLNTYLYGIVTFQYASYYATSFNDPAWVKLFVFSLFSLDTFHSASIIYMAWVFCVENFADHEGLGEGSWPYPFTVIAFATTAFMTHMFLAYRVFRLSKCRVGYGVMILFSIASWVTGITCAVYSWESEAAVRPFVIAWLCLQVGADVLTTGTLVMVLARARTGFHKSNTVVNRLIRGSVQTGLFASLFSIIALVCFLESPSTQFFGMFGIPISRIYSTALMDTLLVRRSLRGTLVSSNEYTTDAIWIINEPIAQEPMMTQDGVQLCRREEIHTDVKLHDNNAPSQSSSSDINEELRVPEHGVG